MVLRSNFCFLRGTNRSKVPLISPSELEPAVLLQEDLLLLPPSRVASGGHRGDEAGRGQKQAGHRSQLHGSQGPAPPLTWCQHPGRRSSTFIWRLRLVVQKPASEHNTSEEEGPAGSESRGSAGARAGFQEHPSASLAFSRPPPSASSALLRIRLSLIKIDMNLFLVVIEE